MAERSLSWLETRPQTGRVEQGAPLVGCLGTGQGHPGLLSCLELRNREVHLWAQVTWKGTQPVSAQPVPCRPLRWSTQTPSSTRSEKRSRAWESPAHQLLLTGHPEIQAQGSVERPSGLNQGPSALCPPEDRVFCFPLGSDSGCSAGLWLQNSKQHAAPFVNLMVLPEIVLLKKTRSSSRGGDGRSVPMAGPPSSERASYLGPRELPVTWHF